MRAPVQISPIRTRNRAGIFSRPAPGNQPPPLKNSESDLLNIYKPTVRLGDDLNSRTPNKGHSLATCDSAKQLGSRQQSFTSITEVPLFPAPPSPSPMPRLAHLPRQLPTQEGLFVGQPGQIQYKEQHIPHSQYRISEQQQSKQLIEFDYIQSDLVKKTYVQPKMDDVRLLVEERLAGFRSQITALQSGLDIALSKVQHLTRQNEQHQRVIKEYRRYFKQIAEARQQGYFQLTRLAQKASQLQKRAQTITPLKPLKGPNGFQQVEALKAKADRLGSIGAQLQELIRQTRAKAEKVWLQAVQKGEEFQQRVGKCEAKVQSVMAWMKDKFAGGEGSRLRLDEEEEFQDQNEKDQRVQELVAIARREGAGPLAVQLQKSGYLKYEESGTYIFDWQGNAFRLEDDQLDFLVRRGHIVISEPL